MRLAIVMLAQIVAIFVLSGCAGSAVPIKPTACAAARAACHVVCDRLIPSVCDIDAGRTDTRDRESETTAGGEE